MKRLLAVWLALLMGAAPPGIAKPPKDLAWAFEAIENAGEPPADAPVWVLWDEAVVAPMDTSGGVRYRRRALLQVLSSRGQSERIQPISYGKNCRLSWYHAWTIRPDGTSEELDKRHTIDVAVSSEANYSDLRRRVLLLRNVGVGTSIALEYVLERDDLFLQDLWMFQRQIPVAVSRYVLELPPNWDHEEAFLNMSPIEPRQEGKQLIWEARSLPGLKGTDYSAPLGREAAQMAVSYRHRSQGGSAQSFRSWDEVAAWYDGLAGPQARTDDALHRQVADVVGPVENPLERVRLIGDYVQKVRYVALELGLSRYRPRPAAEVLESRYGDCKDKATLMKAMLDDAGIDSHLMLVETRTAGTVFPEFPSPIQFNHAILAVPVPEESGLLPVVSHPELGPLLLFDPTDDTTPVGDLPWTDQGARALLAHQEHGGLLELPALPAAASHARRDWDLTLEGKGAAVVEMEADYTGQYARWLRAVYAGIDDSARRERLVAAHASLPGITLDQASFRGMDAAGQPLRIEAGFRVEELGRRAGPLRITKPLRLVDTLVPELPADPGGRAVLLPFRFVETDRMIIRLPSGWVATELPPEVTEQASLGTFTQQWIQETDHLVVDRRVQLDTLEVPLNAYGEARDFFQRINGSRDTSLVLEYR